MNKVTQLVNKIRRKLQENCENRQLRNKQRKIFMAGFAAFNNGSTYFAGNRVKGDKVRVNVDRTSFYQ
jgi:hypothetical protein